jgi:DNA-directed RNA polymerase alpha subunit
MNVNGLELSLRAEHALENAGIETVEQLAKFNWGKFARQRTCGKITIAELAAVVMRLARGDTLRETKKLEKYWKQRRK